MEIAHKRLQANQLELFPEAQSAIRVKMKKSFSALLWSVPQDTYWKLGFSKLHDEVFEAVCIARIVEPTSKIDSLRVLSDLGVDFFKKTTLFRCLAKIEEQDYRKTICQICFDYAKGDDLTLILYDPIEMVTRKIPTDIDDRGIIIYGYKFRPAVRA